MQKNDMKRIKVKSPIQKLLGELDKEMIGDFRRSYRNYLFGELSRSLIADELEHAQELIDKINDASFKKEEFARAKTTTTAASHKQEYVRKFDQKTGKWYSSKKNNYESLEDELINRI